jgi:hypothetical protein
MVLGVASPKSNRGNSRKPSLEDLGFAFAITIAAILFSVVFIFLGGK